MPEAILGVDVGTSSLKAALCTLTGEQIGFGQGAYGLSSPEPDAMEFEGRDFISQPVAVRELPGRVRIERIRQIVRPDGERTSADDAIELFSLDAETVAAEAAPHGLTALRTLEIPATEDYVGSTVVMLRG